jgi:cytidylate kinase
MTSHPEVEMDNSITPVLTISHQYGSGGSLIARDLGRRWSWSVWDKEIVHRIATKYAVEEEYVEEKDERVDSFIERMVGVMGISGFEAAYNVSPPLWLNDTQLMRMTRTIIKEIAEEGRAIIVGRGGNHVLAERSKALHVFLFAPYEVRVQRVMAVDKLARAETERRIASMDRLRTDYVRTFYHADWRDPMHYHLVVDSTLWGESGTADLIAWALEHMS